MAHVVDTHKHMINQTDGKQYFPWQQMWHQALNWAYGAHAPNRGQPPFERDPSRLAPIMMDRLNDPAGEWTTKDMDDAGVTSSIALPIDYDFSWGSASDITIEEKHQYLARMQEKYPGRYYGLAGPDPRRPGAVEIFNRGITEHKLNGLKMIPKMGFYVWTRSATSCSTVASSTMSLPSSARSPRAAATTACGSPTPSTSTTWWATTRI